MDSIINAASQWYTPVTWIVFVCICIMFCASMKVITEAPRRHFNVKACTTATIIAIVACAVAFGVEAIANSTLDHYRSELDSEITREYNVKMKSPDKIEFNSLDKPIEVTSLDEGDTRIYECYIKRNQDGQYRLYTKNDKGVFIELSGASKAMLAE